MPKIKFKRDIKSVSLEEIENFIADKANLVALSPQITSFNNIDELNNDQLIELVRKLDAWGYDNINVDGDIAPALNRTVFMLKLLGLRETAAVFEFIVSHASLVNKLKPLIDEVKFNERLSKKNKEIASGPKNKLHDEIITIMKLTWEKYQFASKNRMIKKIIDHFGEDRISRPTLERWIRLYALGPAKVVRPAPEFSLVFPS